MGRDGTGWAIAELHTASVNPNSSNADLIVAPAWTVNVNSYLKSEFPSNALEPEQCPAGRRKRNRRRNARRFFFSGAKGHECFPERADPGQDQLSAGKQILVNRNRLWAVILFVVPDLTFSADIQLNKRV